MHRLAWYTLVHPIAALVGEIRIAHCTEYLPELGLSQGM